MYKTSASTSIATEAAGVRGRFVHITSLCSLSCNANKRQGRCPLQASNTHTTYIGECYGDVLHEGIYLQDNTAQPAFNQHTVVPVLGDCPFAKSDPQISNSRVLFSLILLAKLEGIPKPLPIK